MALETTAEAPVPAAKEERKSWIEFNENVLVPVQLFTTMPSTAVVAAAVSEMSLLVTVRLSLLATKTPACVKLII